MRTMTRILIAGLIIGGVAHHSAVAAEPGELSLDTSITSIELDAEGQITRIAFSNGVELSDKDLMLGAEEVEIGGMRPLPLQIVTVGESPKQIAIVADFVGPTPVLIPPGSGANLSVNPEGRVTVSLSEGHVLACPAGTCPFFGRCVPCMSADLSEARIHTLVQYRDASGEMKVGLLVAKPEPLTP